MQIVRVSIKPLQSKELYREKDLVVSVGRCPAGRSLDEPAEDVGGWRPKSKLSGNDVQTVVMYIILKD